MNPNINKEGIQTTENQKLYFMQVKSELLLEDFDNIFIAYSTDSSSNFQYGLMRKGGCGCLEGTPTYLIRRLIKSSDNKKDDLVVDVHSKIQNGLWIRPVTLEEFKKISQAIINGSANFEYIDKNVVLQLLNKEVVLHLLNKESKYGFIA